MQLEVISAVLLAGAFAASVWLVGLLVNFAPRIGLVDVPNERSSHARATPRGGGIGVVLVVALTMAAALAAGGSEAASVAWVLLGGIGLAAVSLRDDFRPLGAGVRLVCQLAAAALAVFGAGAFHEIEIPGLSLDLGVFGFALTMVWIVGLTNVYNFMDGIDGIAGIQGVMTASFWLGAGLALDAPPVALVGSAAVGACLGFLRHNWAPARIFLGDVGSAFLGFLFAVLPLLALRWADGETGADGAARLPSAALLAVWPFIGDGAYTLLRRAVRGERVWTPHRTHIYQRLVVAGWSHARVASLYGCWAALSIASASLWLAGRDELAGAGAGAALIALPLLVTLTRLAEGRRRATR